MVYFSVASCDRTKLRSLLHEILSRKTCLGIFWCTFAAFSSSSSLVYFAAFHVQFNTLPVQTLVLMERRGCWGRFQHMLSCGFCLVGFACGEVLSCSFDLKYGWSLSFLDSIMMCVWCCFSFSFLLSKQKTFGQARSCHWFPAAVVWPGQNSCKNQWVYKVWPEYGIQEMAQFDVAIIFYLKKKYFSLVACILYVILT